ncbi:MAG: M14 family metallopeptidase [Acidobacteriota bacterium]|nr:MAG: M14 family metallopeptidase [Acidobacteriota bacterium]
MRALVLLWLAMASEVSAQTIPTPASVLGFEVGADFHLASYDESIAYFKRLDDASDRLKLVQVGETSQGRPFYVALVSSSENLANLERYREISLRLAHPDGLSDEQARGLAREGKAIVHIDGAVHATEVACAQHTIQLAYNLLTGDGDPEIENILENVIFLLWPTLNPDGQNMVVDWYRANVGTPYEVSPLPRLYQSYVGHDNNRDAYMLNMVESRVVARTWLEWEPQIIYTQHQTAPFPTRIWLPPFAEPIGSRVHPLMSRTVNSIGMLMAQSLEERGQIGATHMGTGFDAWYPGYVDYLPMLRNAAAFWTETALYGYATPHFYTVNDFPDDRRSLRSESLYPSPWRGGWWRLRDAVDYMLTASIATLDFAAKFKDDLLYNRYQAGRDTIRKYETEPPYAYFIPEGGPDPVAPVELLRRLAFNGLRVYRLDQAVEQDGRTHPAGTWVVPMNQEFGELARQVLEVQTYPDLREFPEGPPEQPYDAAGWTLPYQMGVRSVEARSPLSEKVRQAMELAGGTTADWSEGELARDAVPFDSVPGVGFDTHPVAAGIVPPPSELRGSGPAIAVPASQNNAYRAVNAAWRDGGRVALDDGGRFIITGSSGDFVDRLALRGERTRASGTEMTRPRVGLYRPWSPSMDEGWTRWLLEQYGFGFVNVRDADFSADGLGERFDVIVLAENGRRSIVEGFAEGTVPPRYAGGIGKSGVRALDAFVRGGGTLVCLNRASTFAIEELHLPVKDVVAELEREQFYASGSILEVEVDAAHPVMAGMPERGKIFFSRSPVFTTEKGFEGSALAKYQQAGSPLLSGYLLGADHLHGYAAALDVVHGEGHVILIGFRPQWRGQPFGTFRVLFNSVLYHGTLTERGGTPDFWTPPAVPQTEKTEK